MTNIYQPHKNCPQIYMIVLFKRSFRLYKHHQSILQMSGAPDKPCGEAVLMLTQNCCQTIHEEWYVFDSFHLCTEAFDL